ncbi:PPOX class F420-dependent oxidoreductase [Mycobacterium sp. SMC-4]|uniref:PPOX class F420-dependent oxidoreductase n=1 Tax=Mycobacterium sp. SMC-4 TaxID=2857059 RepID=UPI0021B3CDBC|nr:PPOX class F420-dependent oxidoreductase [Mycobacterium sp. SMC-4]UXA17407.1 PPOX class F420-dependent oxidoreductase [Mycobacterium sp. SMC-4]
MTFTSYEIDFMSHTELGRLATIQPDGTPQNSPVGFTFNAALGTIDIYGYQMAKSRKYRNIAGNPKVAFVIDDITARDPWRVRCLEIRGTAEQVTLGDAPREPNGDPLDTAIIRITPRRVISFGIDDQRTEPHQLTAHVRNFDTPEPVAAGSPRRR